MKGTMKVLTTIALIVLASVYASAQEKAEDDISILKPGDRVYSDAVNASAIFNQHGLKINTIHRSKLEGFFLNISSAAVFKTDQGAFEIIFFPEADQAGKITVTERREGKRHIYSFTGQPQPRPSHDVMNAAYPMQFIAKGNWFVVINDNRRLSDLLRKILN
jgi:hypothetical protein